MTEFKENDIVRVVDNTGSLDGCDIEIGALGQVVHCFKGGYTIVIEIDNRKLFVCDDEIELIVRGLN